VSQIAEKACLSITTTHNIVKAFVEEGLVVPAAKTPTYDACTLWSFVARRIATRLRGSLSATLVLAFGVGVHVLTEPNGSVLTSG
jgi:DNA-binding IclR family transcriptional regulator